MMNTPIIHILLATYNGAKYLAEQLDSIARQTHTAWTLTVSDDGSTDDTLAIVTHFAKQVSQPITVLQGPNMGSSTRNFCYLIQHAPADHPQDLFAFCDQDDVWLDDKLQRAVQLHEQHASQPVRLYCGRTQIVNEHLKPIGLSPGIQRPPSFGNALVQNIASGNTMVMSHAVLMAQKKVLPEHSVWHDWTTYLVATALGGMVCFDDQPSLLYRQHDGNVIGSNNNASVLLESFKQSMLGRYQYRITCSLLALEDLQINAKSSVLETTSVIESIRACRNPLKRVTLLGTSSLRRQSFLSNTALLIAALVGKL
jgi:glycosyltransferase involved in cell wall biosynthesis